MAFKAVHNFKISIGSETTRRVYTERMSFSNQTKGEPVVFSTKEILKGRGYFSYGSLSGSQPYLTSALWDPQTTFSLNTLEIHLFIFMMHLYTGRDSSANHFRPGCNLVSGKLKTGLLYTPVNAVIYICTLESKKGSQTFQSKTTRVRNTLSLCLIPLKLSETSIYLPLCNVKLK